MWASHRLAAMWSASLIAAKSRASRNAAWSEGSAGRTTVVCALDILLISGGLPASHTALPSWRFLQIFADSVSNTISASVLGDGTIWPEEYIFEVCGVNHGLDAWRSQR